jgi:hypothetical protein
MLSFPRVKTRGIFKEKQLKLYKMKNRHQYYLKNKEQIKKKSKEYYLEHKDDYMYRIRHRFYNRERIEKMKFLKEFEELKLQVLYLEKILGLR